MSMQRTPLVPTRF